ncbi:CKLF-like MARVEL transmembrane domain-containing protein 4 [Caerostris extrusa]|uniref:CKLF-like MARVEL transmembrane domain-containing protein 4 n=1 Tax=Caerostris extrusa TaxID=172846 RepID=A0AAV4RPY3_CAEEX|nr:CKLF-like MARVEL transmembrane domain-containing protein 4 [Caerostris extrusa]
MPGYVLDERDRGLRDMETIRVLVKGLRSTSWRTLSSVAIVRIFIDDQRLVVRVPHEPVSNNRQCRVINNLIGMICIMVSRCSWCSNSNWFNFCSVNGSRRHSCLVVFLPDSHRGTTQVCALACHAALLCDLDIILHDCCSSGGSQRRKGRCLGRSRFFGFVGAILYASDCYTKYKSWRDGIPAQRLLAFWNISSNTYFPKKIGRRQ